MAHKQMSLEAALKEEADEILSLLDGPKSKSKSPTSPRAPLPQYRTGSPAGARQSPMRRSMLDIAPGVPRDEHIAGRATSAAGNGRNSAVTSPTGSTFSDPGHRPTVHHAGSAPAGHGHTKAHRASHGSTSPVLPTIHQGLPSPHSTMDEHRFDMLSNVESYAKNKKGSHGETKRRPNSMSMVYGPDGRPRGGKSKSPAGPKHSKSQSPTEFYVTESGKVVDLGKAHRKLSDSALARAGGSLAYLPTKRMELAQRGQEIAPDGGVRLTKDYDEEQAVDSSDDDDDDDGGDDTEDERGRARARKGSDYDEPESPRQVTSLLAAAEEERKNVAATTKSPSDGSVSLAGLSADQLFGATKLKKPVIHPRTSFDVGGASGVATPIDSDEEERKSDFNVAQMMALTLSPIHSSPEAHRCIRQILRGDFRRYQLEAEQGLRRQRMYLVATDLSEEAAHALEWTIGTVLRDGDTLLAVYAVDEEAGTGGDPNAVANNSVGIGEGPNQMMEAAAIVRTLSNQQGLVVPGSPRGRASSDRGARSQSAFRSLSQGVYKDKFEKERYHATQEITDRCIKLLRKTKLQVRVVVEVFHCKSPKHMITEVIDYLEPTLVILGSRGRSALKGVLLGSFSNYLVTKSSVPVMVARKRLRKHSKFKGMNPRLSNMLQTPGNRLESAVIDRPNMGSRRPSQT